MRRIAFLLLALADALDGMGLSSEAASVRELGKDEPAPSPVPVPAKAPKHLFPPEYSVEKREHGLLGVHGRLYEGALPIHPDMAQQEALEIGRREEILERMPGKLVGPDRVVVTVPGMEFVLSGGRIVVRRFRYLPADAEEFARSLDGQPTTVENLERIAKESRLPRGAVGGRSGPGDSELMGIATQLVTSPDGRHRFPAYADKETMQEDLQPYLANRLALRLAAASRYVPGGTHVILSVFERIPEEKRKFMIPTGHGRWVHVVNKGVGGDLRSYIGWFGKLRGEVSVSELQGDPLYLASRYPLCLVLEGRPVVLFDRDIWSKVDGWTGRRFIPPGAPVGIQRREGFLVPIDSKVVGVITNSPRYHAQAEELRKTGEMEFVSGSPTAFSAGSDAQVEQLLKEEAFQWPAFGPALADEEPPAAIYLITAKEETTSKQGFLYPEIAEWIREHGGRIASGAHQAPARIGSRGKPLAETWNPGLWDKGAGIMVVFPDRVPPPPRQVTILRPDRPGAEFSPTEKHMAIRRLSASGLPRLEDNLPPPPELAHRPKGDRRFGLRRLRRLVIQKGHPFEFMDNGRIRTTKEGMAEFRRLLANPPPLPERYGRRP